ncbi:6-pyruvoyltetrahydropterin/6-carboxytetrahydropterin synthase [Alkalihalobacillus xiaoxiensis]|uniref:6-carboxy-5,6,7,8-tetrahydropterin synthase n=1 Tax=Shouchella xiaoxiensis TaxID=766895 RepID=A0ABS2T233_9BACI|nr:6-carboxytetrahydropterin synthase QueD [Shouchella xiaoxiensis]MBM7840759.1 6-pyruvoyltetrahydropterin/6-carboxytetrahydropterin synthase [Shouchella xiaoxiensis]
MIHQLYPSVVHPYTFELNKDMQLAAAHYIDHKEAGKCRQLHGHTYVINLTIGGDELNELGFLVDFKTLKQTIHDRFDHTLLNEDEYFNNQPPSTEKMAETIYQLVENQLLQLKNKPTCLQVFVRETPTSYVIYRPKEQANG